MYSRVSKGYVLANISIYTRPNEVDNVNLLGATTKAITTMLLDDAIGVGNVFIARARLLSFAFYFVTSL